MMLTLAAYASPVVPLIGRDHHEAPPGLRTEYQRDRDRIVHCAAFRRLEQKTQVFASFEADNFRTRLTHTMEVAQIARTVACVLNLNETLTEAIALAHDVGHAPFGHAGQQALNELNLEFGGFEHNAHGLRVVESLEARYAAFPGLNLTFETRQGILKHCSLARAQRLGRVAERFFTGEQASLEAQVANLADEIAYNNHDVDDGIRAGLLETEEVFAREPFRSAYAEVVQVWPGLDRSRLCHEVIRRSINLQVTDLVTHSQAAINASGIASPQEVAAAGPLIGLSPGMLAHHRALKIFLRDHLYQHHRVQRMAVKGRRVIADLYLAFREETRLLPKDYQRSNGSSAQAEAITDYLAGLTDRQAVQEHERVFRPGVAT